MLYKVRQRRGRERQVGGARHSLNRTIGFFWLSDPLKVSFGLEESRLGAGRNQAGNGSWWELDEM